MLERVWVSSSGRQTVKGGWLMRRWEVDRRQRRLWGGGAGVLSVALFDSSVTVG
jgi:hypothetical protein